MDPSGLVVVPWDQLRHLRPLARQPDRTLRFSAAYGDVRRAARREGPAPQTSAGARVAVVARGSIGLYVCDIAHPSALPTPSSLTRILSSDLSVEATGRIEELGEGLASLALVGFCDSDRVIADQAYSS